MSHPIASTRANSRRVLALRSVARSTLTLALGLWLVVGTAAGASATGERLALPVVLDDAYAFVTKPAELPTAFAAAESAAVEPSDDQGSDFVDVVAASEPIPSGRAEPEWAQLFSPQRCWGWHILPQGLIYRDYLAGAKQSRFRSVWHNDSDEGAIWDTTVGGHVGLLRCGSTGQERPVGFQLDIEGSAHVRLDREDDENLDATDYRFGVPLSWGNERYQTRFGYYHISSHVGDEFLENNPDFDRLNFVRETLIWGHSYYLDPVTRVYGEIGYGVLTDVSEQWEFQFGGEYSPACATGPRGAPFAAINYHIREELAYDGNVVGQVGWSWRRSPASGLLRLGLEYYHGRDDQYSFFRNSQNKFGFGMWYDY